MAALVEPAVYRPGFYYVACLQCKMSVGIENTGESVRLFYDVGDWRRCKCSCDHGPIGCTSFLELQRVVTELTARH